MTTKEDITTYPHVYKKGKILNLKRLDEDQEETAVAKKYIFSSNQHSFPTIMSSCNNLNQINGRIFLGVYKLLSYFGLSKDPSEKLSKDCNIFNSFSLSLKGGKEEETHNKLEDIKTLLNLQSSRIANLELKMDKIFKTPKDLPITREEVLDSFSRLQKINDFLKQILGQE